MPPHGAPRSILDRTPLREKSLSNATPPTIYNLCPWSAGPIDSWHQHVSRITAMNFNWVHLNAPHYAALSGRPHSEPAIDENDSFYANGAAAKAFVAAARGAGLSVMADLVISQSEDVASQRFLPATRLGQALPTAEFRSHTSNGTTGSHLAPGNWHPVIDHYLNLGLSGFCCRAAHEFPERFWRALIATARRRNPNCLFVADTLGCAPERAAELAGSGFDYFFNSAGWWDFRSQWLIEQHEIYRKIAPTIAFPIRAGRPDTSSGASRQTVEDRLRLQYAFCAAVSSSLLMPMGYEYGGDIQHGTPFKADISDFISQINREKQEYRVLSVEGGLKRVTAFGSTFVGLMRTDRDDIRFSEQAVVILINPDSKRVVTVDTGLLHRETQGRFSKFTEIFAGNSPSPKNPGDVPITVGPMMTAVIACEQPIDYRKRSSRQAGAIKRFLDSGQTNRIAIEKVIPELDCGRYPVKRIVGDVLDIRADIFTDGHDKIRGFVRHRMAGDREWQTQEMRHIDNDRWQAGITLKQLGRFEFTIEAVRDEFSSWRADVEKKLAAQQDVTLDLEEGRVLLARAETGAASDERESIRHAVERSRANLGPNEILSLLLEPAVVRAMCRASERSAVSSYDRVLAVTVDRPAARFSAWYEMFPRSASLDATRHGTFDDVIALLPSIREMGFNVLYFPPIHPIGLTNRKGRNNSPRCEPGDLGSPYAIGSADGGHDAIHPALGTLDDFRRLVAAAHEHDLEIALDFAIQCSPDHPWLNEHPDWFDYRPDGSIKFAENPPKKYQDIVNVKFFDGAFPDAWAALRDVVVFWAEHGVRIFRVDNPHTKPFQFWEWMIRDVQSSFPDVIFLSEAFTRPKVMNRLAKLGFTQSYTYFTWRNTKAELVTYINELCASDAREFFRPNFFANTPDINPQVLQTNNPAAYKMRLVLAALLGGSYGIYSGFEFCEGTPLPGREEYLNSEKYELRAWNWKGKPNICDYIARVNRIRTENPCLHDHLNTRFYNAWNDHILVFGKMTAGNDNAILVAVNLDPDGTQEANFEVPLWEFSLPDDASIAVEDAFTGARFTWLGKVQTVRLDPKVNPCAIWRLLPPHPAADASSMSVRHDR